MQLVNGENADAADTQDTIKEFEEKQTYVKDDLEILLNDSESDFTKRFFNKNLHFDYISSPPVATLATVNDELVDPYRLNTVDEVIQFEVLQIVKNNIFYKRCKYCGEYFMPLGRTDSEYCYRIMLEKQIHVTKSVQLRHSIYSTKTMKYSVPISKRIGAWIHASERNL